jgi:hypothetical protein
MPSRFEAISRNRTAADATGTERTKQNNSNGYRPQDSWGSSGWCRSYLREQFFLRPFAFFRQVSRTGWIDTAEASRSSFLAQFAKTLGRDLEAVRLAIATQWNNGPVEGHINRLKVIKRQMYGRASFALLKARVLPSKTDA